MDDRIGSRETEQEELIRGFYICPECAKRQVQCDEPDCPYNEEGESDA